MRRHRTHSLATTIFLVGACGPNADIREIRQNLLTCEAELKASEKKLQEIQKVSLEDTKKFDRYYRQLANMKLELKSNEQQVRAEHLSRIVSRHIDIPPASRVENALFWAIQTNHEKWSKLDYEPLNERAQVIDPLKAVFLYVELSQKVFNSEGLGDKKTPLVLLQSVFGDEVGLVLSRVELSELKP